MSVIFKTVDDWGPGVQVESDVASTEVVIDAGVLVGSSDTTAVWLKANGHDVLVRGTVFGNQTGILLYNTSDGIRNSVTIAQGGSVSGGGDAIRAQGYTHILNSGDISSGSTGIELDTGDRPSEIVNTGIISALGWAIATGGDAGGFVTLTNHGMIFGGYSGGNASDRIVNRGTLTGDVMLGKGGDSFDNVGGATVQARVMGQEGNDSFTPGMEKETFYGDSGSDSLSFSTGGALEVSLVEGEARTGRAAGDSYSGIENVTGSQSGADWIAGNGVSNRLDGLAGRDTLLGRGGADVLTGGTGADQLRGGAGADAFQYHSASEGGDRVEDFGASDRFRVWADGFGGGLVGDPFDPEVLGWSRFRSRSDNVAQDSNDRFVFRTTDRTLWFDVDGKGGVKAVLIADLQAGAVVTHDDILLY